MSSQATLDPVVLAGIKDLVVRARTVVEGALVGEHVSPFRGGSVEFAQHRAYSPGDELRYVDWRLFARTDDYHVKQFDVTTNLRAYLLIDTSGSMGYPQGDPVTKFRYASFLAGAMAYLLIQQADAVALCLNDQENQSVRYLPPRGQIPYLHELCQTMEQQETGGQQGILELLQFASERIVHRSMVMVFSDFFVPLEPLISRLKHLQARGNDVMTFQILHADEQEFPFHRYYRFQSMEDQRFLNADAKSIRRHYLEALDVHQKSLNDGMRQCGIDFTTAVSHEPPSLVISRHLSNPIRAKKRPKPF